ncbi:MAG TPA: hypothetical protein VI356_07275 [Myxococcales bacterium]
MRSIVVIGMLAGACGTNATANPCAGVSLDGLSAVRTTQIVALQWKAVPGAARYHVYLRGDPPSKEPLATVTEPQAAFSGATGLGDLDFSVAPVLAQECSKARLIVPAPPALSGTVDEGGPHLSWNGIAGAPQATIGRGSDAAHIAAVGGTLAQSFDDAGAADSTDYTYQLGLSGPNLLLLSNFVLLTTLPGAPQVTATPRVTGVGLQITGAGFNPNVDMVSPQVGPAHFNGDSWDCPSLETCTYEVRMRDFMRRLGKPTRVSGTRAPDAPALLGAVSTIGGVRLTWENSIGAAMVRVLRRPNPASPWVLLAETAGTSWFDALPEPFIPSSYGLQSVGRAGEIDTRIVLPAGDQLFSTPSPDSMNLDPVVSSFGPGAGQVVRATQGGHLVAIEAPCAETDPTITVHAGDFVVATATARVLPLALSGPSLDARDVRSNVFDLSSAAIPVSAGASLRLDFSGSCAASSATDGGFSQESGHADPAHSLAYRMFIQPDGSLPPPLVQAEGGSGGIALGWAASPAASSYDVLDASDAVIANTVETHFFAATAPGFTGTFRVRANGPSGSVLSQPATATALLSSVSTANLCTGPDFTDPFPGTWAQTATVEAGGLLEGVEVGIVSRDPLALRVLDANGVLLASGTTAASASTVPAPLSPALRRFAFADLTAAGVRLQPGQVIRIDVDVPPSSRTGPQLSFDTYPGGRLFAPVFGLDNHDLCFKVFVLAGA